MKKILFALLFVTTVSQAQYNFKYDKLFMEAGLGLGIPLTQVSPTGENVPLSLVHGQGSLRYMFTKNVGLLGSLSYDKFENGKQTSDQTMASLEVCYNLGNLFELTRNTRGKFGLLVHGGAGVGLLSSKYYNGDKIGAILVGVKPFVALSDKVSFFTDITHKSTLKQLIYYDGNLAGRNINGSQLGITFGFIVALGQNEYHADSAY